MLLFLFRYEKAQLNFFVVVHILIYYSYIIHFNMYYLLYYMYYLLTFLTHGWHVRWHSSSLCGGCYATFITKTHVFTRLFISCPVQWHLCILILLTVLFVLTPLVFQVQPPGLLIFQFFPPTSLVKRNSLIMCVETMKPLLDNFCGCFILFFLGGELLQKWQGCPKNHSDPQGQPDCHL